MIHQLFRNSGIHWAYSEVWYTQELQKRLQQEERRKVEEEWEARN